MGNIFEKGPEWKQARNTFATNVFSIQGISFVFSKEEFSIAVISGESFVSVLDGWYKKKNNIKGIIINLDLKWSCFHASA